MAVSSVIPVSCTSLQFRMNVGIPSLAWTEWHHANGGISVTSNNSFPVIAVKQYQVSKLRFCYRAQWKLQEKQQELGCCECVSNLWVNNNYHRSDCGFLNCVLFFSEIHRGLFAVDFIFLSTVKLKLVSLLWDSDS